MVFRTGVEMSMVRRLSFVFAVALAGGCAPRLHSSSAVSPATRPVPPTATEDPKSKLSLDQIDPPIKLSPASTQASAKPSLGAIELYARACDELLQNQRFTAINDLEKAVALDPGSSDLFQALGRAYLGPANFNDSSIAALEKAAAIQPDDLDVQLQIGREYLNKGDLSRAITALRRAMLTTEYGKGDDQAALTDFFLAAALQRNGYDRAALDRYQSLLDRIRSPGPNLRGNPELNYLISRPESIWIEMGGLYERGERYDDALANYLAAAERDPDNFELQVRIVHILTALHRPAAKERAAAIVKQFGARPESITLLRETYRAFGNESGAGDVLRQMLVARPTDRITLYALSDILQQLGKKSEARDLMVQATRTNKYPFDMIVRLQRLYESDGDWRKTAGLLIEATQQRADLVARLAPLWARLLRSTSSQRVQFNDLKTIAVPREQEAVKQFWISTLAGSTNRDGLARTALEQAIEAQPPFVPAYRAALNDAMDGPDHTQAVQAVLDRAAGSPALAAELNGMVLLDAKKPAEAEAAFRRAIELGANSPFLQDELLDAVLRQNQDNKAEQLLLGIVDRWPDFEPAYLQLVGFYASRGRDNQTVKTLETWLTNDPSSTTARMLQARFLLETRRPDAAEVLIDGLLAENCDDGDVLTSITSLYAPQGRLDVLAGKLSSLYAAQPNNTELLSHLVDVQIALHKPNEASRLIDAARISFAGDADRLYLVSNLYQRLDQKQSAEDVLLAALKVNPKQPSVNNDLGYGWVDGGKNLDQAEAMVRTAVAAEPDNQAFLDSLGWVLYKRSQFNEAVHYLQQASEGNRPDPVVLDHLGDALYRMNRKDDAHAQWQLASDRLEKTATSRDDLKQLRLQLNAKLKQVKDGNPVSVAPVTAAAAKREQAQSN